MNSEDQVKSDIKSDKAYLKTLTHNERYKEYKAKWAREQKEKRKALAEENLKLKEQLLKIQNLIKV